MVRAPIMHRMSGLSLARHWQGVCGHVHLSNEFGIVWSGGLLIFLALVSAKKHVLLLACSVCVMRCIALSCLEVLRPFR